MAGPHPLFGKFHKNYYHFYETFPYLHHHFQLIANQSQKVNMNLNLNLTLNLKLKLNLNLTKVEFKFSNSIMK